MAEPEESTTIEALLGGVPALAARPDLVEAARGIFRFTQFLLDDEDNLTRIGNLSGAAKEKLRARALELLGVESESKESESGDEPPATENGA